MNEILFWSLLGIIILFALYTIFAKGPVLSLMSLMLVFIMSAIWLLMQGLDFFALVFLSVYVGGIVVFFLFVLLTMPLEYVEKFFTGYYELVFICLIGSICLFFFGFGDITQIMLGETPGETTGPVMKIIGLFNLKNSLYVVAALLYSTYSLYVFIGGIILYIAMFGSLAILSENYQFIKIIDKKK